MDKKVKDKSTCFQLNPFHRNKSVREKDFGGLMERKERKEYFIFTSIFCGIGFVLYGGLAVAGKDLLKIPLNIFWIVLLSGLAGGLLLGGLVSGIILFSRFFKRQALFVKILLCVFFPFTIICIFYVGVFSFFPYGIYNFIALKREEYKNMQTVT